MAKFLHAMDVYIAYDPRSETANQMRVRYCIGMIYVYRPTIYVTTSTKCTTC